MHASEPTTTGEPEGPVEPQVGAMRLVIEVDDWDAALRFYRDALGLRMRQGYANEVNAQLILEVGPGTIELTHPALRKVDGESDAANDTGPRPARIRLAFESGDPRSTIDALVAAGGRPLAEPAVVAADSYSGRVLAPDGLPVTVFAALSEPDFSEPPPSVED